MEQNEYNELDQDTLIKVGLLAAEAAEVLADARLIINPDTTNAELKSRELEAWKVRNGLFLSLSYRLAEEEESRYDGEVPDGVDIPEDLKRDLVTLQQYMDVPMLVLLIAMVDGLRAKKENQAA